ncbi:hypothetical protein C2E23DRAFT_214474 [Lenzites betulinus]|nr:hypothetical protein C2E23DRAFT_214474 [Lenzites betulinus]
MVLNLNAHTTSPFATRDMADPTTSRSAYATSPHQMSTADRHRAYISHNILHHHLERALLKSADSTDAYLSQGLALGAILQSSSTIKEHEQRPTGGLATEDLVNMAPVSLPALQADFLRKLASELRSTLLTVANYHSPSDDEDEDDRLHAASELPQRINREKGELTHQNAELLAHRTQVLRLIDQINLASPALDTQLAAAFSILPPHLRAARSAEADVLATTIEAALHKLLLIRARAERALYTAPVSATISRPAPPKPTSKSKSKRDLPPDLDSSPAPLTVADAVSVAYEALLDRQRAQDEEAAALDGQIAAYENALGLVEGGRGREGAFAQVVRDMARVKRETEECRRDLKRLGWTEG